MFVDVHVLQTVPPSNLNRDDTGAPKSAYYGGVRRARVSSQAWKRAVRRSYASHLETADLGVRTRRALELLVDRLVARGVEHDDAVERGKGVLTALGLKLEAPRSAKSKPKDGPSEPEYDRTGYLIFWSNRQLDQLADLALQDGKPNKKEAQAAADTEHGIEVSLFGRMVAEAADYSVDSAVQVAHAISTHAVATEQDYFTAVDDQVAEDETGAGMIGTVEFNAATLYRYATVNVDQLERNLGDHGATMRAVEAFVRGFIASMPTGKQNTFANRTVPDAVVVCIRDDQPINFVGAFEEAITSQTGFVRPSAEALADYARGVQSFADQPAQCLVAVATSKAEALESLGEVVTVGEMVERVGSAVRDHAFAGTPG